MQALWQWWGAQASPKKKKKKESGGSRESAELQERRRPKGRERTGRSEMTLCKHPCNDGHRRLKPRMYVWFFSVFHRSEEAAGGLSGSRVQPGRETGGLCASKLCSLH